MTRRFPFLATLLCTALLAGSNLMAQPQPQQPGQGNQGGFQGQGGQGNFQGGGRGGRGDPAAFQQFQLDNIKELLGVTDAEWQVLMPKVQKVLAAQQEVNSGRGGGRGGRGRGGNGGPNGGGGGGGRGGNQQDTALSRAMAELRTLMDSPNASAPQINDKLGALRKARQNAQANYDAAQKDLKELLTPKQEGLLVVNGYLQ